MQRTRAARHLVIENGEGNNVAVAQGISANQLGAPTVSSASEGTQGDPADYNTLQEELAAVVEYAIAQGAVNTHDNSPLQLESLDLQSPRTWKGLLSAVLHISGANTNLPPGVTRMQDGTHMVRGVQQAFGNQETRNVTMQFDFGSPSDYIVFSNVVYDGSINGNLASYAQPISGDTFALTSDTTSSTPAHDIAWLAISLA